MVVGGRHTPGSGCHRAHPAGSGRRRARPCWIWPPQSRIGGGAQVAAWLWRREREHGAAPLRLEQGFGSRVADMAASCTWGRRTTVHPGVLCVVVVMRRATSRLGVARAAVVAGRLSAHRPSGEEAE